MKQQSSTLCLSIWEVCTLKCTLLALALDKHSTRMSLNLILNGVYIIDKTNGIWSLPSRLALRPEGSSKLHPFNDAPSALEQSILTPWRLAHCQKQRKLESNFEGMQCIIWVLKREDSKLSKQWWIGNQMKEILQETTGKTQLLVLPQIFLNLVSGKPTGTCGKQ